MKKFLTKKWLGPVCLFVYVLGISLFLTFQISPALKEVFPKITQEADAFLPITIQNGEIVEPADTVINKSYSSDGKKFNITLDTRTEKLDLNALPDSGIYFSRKCVYIVSDEETKVRCSPSAQSQEPIIITKDVVEKLVGVLSKYMNAFLSAVFVVVLFVAFYCTILFYTIIMHWIVALLTKTTFGQTLFVNTFVYMACNLLEIFTPININFLIKVILFICINVVICKCIKKDEIE